MKLNLLESPHPSILQHINPIEILFPRIVGRANVAIRNSQTIESGAGVLVGSHLSGKGCLHGDVEVGNPQYVGIGIVMTVEQGEHHTHHILDIGSSVYKRNDRLLAWHIPLRSAQCLQQTVVALGFQVNGAYRHREVDEEAVALFFLFHCRKLFHQQFLHTLRQSLHAGGGVNADNNRTDTARRRETQSTRRLADIGFVTEHLQVLRKIFIDEELFQALVDTLRPLGGEQGADGATDKPCGVRIVANPKQLLNDT